MRVFGGQRIDILLSEKEMAEIEKLEIGPQKFPRDFVVERLMRVVAFFQKPPDRNGDLFGVGFWHTPMAEEPAQRRPKLR